MPLHPTTAKAIKANLERITLYLGYGQAGRERYDFLMAKAKELGFLNRHGFPSIPKLLNRLIAEKYPEYTKTQD